MCGYMHLCACKESRRGNQVLSFQSSPIPLNQGLSLNMGLAFSQLVWNPEGSSNLPDLSPLGTKVTGMYIMATLLIWVLKSKSILIIVNQMLLTIETAISSASHLPFYALTKN